MKILLTLLATFICSFVFSQGVKYKNYKDSSGVYLVEYALNGAVFTPLINPPGEAHYVAMIKVYEIKGKDTIPMWHSFPGHYTVGGCCDQPSWWVGKAKKGDREWIKMRDVIIEKFEEQL